MEHFRFLNLEYWYCIFYSLFGGRCTEVEGLNAPSASVPGTGIEGMASTTAASGGGGGFFGAVMDAAHGVWEVVGPVFGAIWAGYATLAYSVSGLLFLGIVGSIAGLLLLRYRERSLYGRLPPDPPGSHRVALRWHELLDRAMSADPKEWRESVLSADVLLGELLGSLGYPGEGSAEKLRSVPEGAFVTLPAAWEAHRVRNFVSSGGSDFILTQREAFRVMKLYEQVFEEFKFV
ncbi:MAG: hypothetical protein AAB923_00755 [Patescibacteria group bacterium]